MAGAPAEWGTMVGAGLMRLAAVVVVALALVPSVSAQPPAAEAREGGGPPAIHARIQALEQALAAAVGRSARAVEEQLPPGAPGLVLFAGPIQVRGFRLEGYGVFFDVEYPVLRGSILWSMQRLAPFELDLDVTLEMLRRRFGLPAGAPGRGYDGRTPFDGTRGPARPERVGARAPARSAGPRYRTDAARGAAPDGAARAGVDPQGVYQGALRVSLTEALLLGGRGLSAMLPEDALLTVAARDATGAPGRDGRLRVRARDLVALGEGRVSLAEVRDRIEVSGFQESTPQEPAP